MDGLEKGQFSIYQKLWLTIGGKSTNFHVLLEISESITTSFQNTQSGDNKTSFNVRGFSSTLKT